MPRRLCIDCRQNWSNGDARCPECLKSYNARRYADKAKYRTPDYKRAKAMWRSLIQHVPQQCPRCKQPIYATMEWHLDHMPDGQLLPSHAICNIKGSHTDGNRKPKKT